MRKMVRRIFILISILLFSILPLVNATIMLSQPETLYNLGDEFSVSATIKPNQDGEDFFTLKLRCEGQSIELRKEYLTISAGEEKNIDEKIILSKQLLGNLKGECNVLAIYLDEQVTSQKFEITDNIKIDLSLDKFNYDAGEMINVQGKAIKSNSENVDGYVDIYVQNTDIRITRDVIDGDFNANFSLPDDKKAGDYEVIAEVYDAKNENKGSGSMVINIRSQPEKIEIAINKQSVKPGDTITFQVFLYDQANDIIKGDISVIVRDTDDKKIIEKLVKIEDYIEIGLNENSSAGYWEIEAILGDIATKRLFYIEEAEIARFEIIDDELIITNIGNVAYKKAVEIKIDKEIEVKHLNLRIGESKKYRLVAPDGDHNIKVSDGTTKLTESGVFLTGNVIGVVDIKTGSIFYRYPIIWLFLIVVFGLFILMLIERTTKRKFYASPGKSKEKLKIPVTKTKAGEDEDAEHALVLHGKKDNVGVTAIKIKDLDKLKGNSSEALEKIKTIVRENKGSIYKTPDFLIGLFSSATTKTFGNEILSVRVAKEIDKTLKEHNKKFKDKIDYGIGLNSGELIVKKDKDGKLKFTSVGKTLTLSKKVASLAENDILLSEYLQNRIRGEVKTDKKTKEGVNVYSIKSMVDREKHSKFIADFLNRLKEEGKSGKKS